jgi:hypothetical protein
VSHDRSKHMIIVIDAALFSSAYVVHSVQLLLENTCSIIRLSIRSLKAYINIMDI